MDIRATYTQCACAYACPKHKWRYCNVSPYDGSKTFILGNIEEVTIAKGNVDMRRALSSTGAEYLRSLDKEYLPTGVHINDPKGLFIFRWYREVKADGSPVTGQRYQNPQCAAYQLTLDNDGDPFVWK